MKWGVALFRHGDRLPIDKCWANDNVWDCGRLYIEERSMPSLGTWENVSRLHRKQYLDGKEVFPGACMAGQLTLYGYNQHLANAQNLKQTYNVFMPSQLDTTQLVVRSTDVPRTLQSAQALIRGLYPWTNQLNTTEMLDIYTVDAAREYLFPNTGNCAKLASYEAQAKTSVAYQSWVSTVLVPLMQQASTYYGLPMANMPSPINVFDCLSAHRCHNYPLPGNLPDSLYNQVVQALEWEYKYVYNYPDRLSYGRLAMGQLYLEVFSNFVDAISSNYNGPKFRFFSAHDTSVMPFLNAIGAWDGIWAPYASLVQMELFTSSTGATPLVRFIYNRQPLILPSCGSEFCSFDQFTSLVQPLLLKDHSSECQTTSVRKANIGVYTNDGW